MPAYVNPFGAYAEGQVQGGEQERATQEGARRARAEDWQHRYLDPITLETDQRANELGRFRVPYEREAVNDASQQLRAQTIDARLRTAGGLLTATGDPNLVQDVAHYADSNYVNQPNADVINRNDFTRNIEMGNQDINRMYRTDLGAARMTSADAAVQNAQTRAQVAGRTAAGGSYVPPSARAFGAPTTPMPDLPTSAPTAAPAPAATPGMAPAAAPAAPAAASYDGNDQAEVSPHAAYLQDAYQNVPGFASLHPMQQAAIAHHAVNYNNQAAAKSTQPSVVDQYATA